MTLWSSMLLDAKQITNCINTMSTFRLESQILNNALMHCIFCCKFLCSVFLLLLKISSFDGRKVDFDDVLMVSYVTHNLVVPCS